MESMVMNLKITVNDQMKLALLLGYIIVWNLDTGGHKENELYK